jgi:O-acetylhomoserine/O-acetylserine sulfhydrylase-like pyridoxal-dependent enzyme
VFEREANIGGKLVNAVSRERLDAAVLLKEIERTQSVGIEFKLNTNVDNVLYEKLKKELSITEKMIRLSIGVENYEDIIFDINQALESA